MSDKQVLICLVCTKRFKGELLFWKPNEKTMELYPYGLCSPKCEKKYEDS